MSETTERREERRQATKALARQCFREDIERQIAGLRHRAAKNREEGSALLPSGRPYSEGLVTLADDHEDHADELERLLALALGDGGETDA